MSVNLPVFNAQQYSTNVQLMLQIKGSKLSSAVETGSHVGKQASPVDQVGAIEANKVTSRFAPMPRTDAALDRRWVFPTDYDVPQMIDSFDKLRLLSDPTSKYVTNATYALGRKKDAELITAFFGTNKTGEQGATSTTFPTSTNQITVSIGGTNSRINVAKLIAAKEVLMANQVDLDNDPIYVGITAKDHSALLNEIQVISSDFNGADRPVLKDGKVDRFLGMNFIHVELLETLSTGTNAVYLPVWAKSGMYLGQWNDITSNVSQRNDIQGLPWQAYNYMTVGATRLEEKKIMQIVSYR